jgi:hypothetical protein
MVTPSDMDDSSGMRITDLIISREAPLPFEEPFVSGSASDRYHLAVSDRNQTDSEGTASNFGPNQSSLAEKL